jgi:hypothetical protein
VGGQSSFRLLGECQPAAAVGAKRKRGPEAGEHASPQTDPSTSNAAQASAPQGKPAHTNEKRKPPGKLAAAAPPAKKERQGKDAMRPPAAPQQLPPRAPQQQKAAPAQEPKKRKQQQQQQQQQPAREGAADGRQGKGSPAPSPAPSGKKKHSEALDAAAALPARSLSAAASLPGAATPEPAPLPAPPGGAPQAAAPSARPPSAGPTAAKKLKKLKRRQKRETALALPAAEKEQAGTRAAAPSLAGADTPERAPAAPPPATQAAQGDGSAGASQQAQQQSVEDGRAPQGPAAGHSKWRRKLRRLALAPAVAVVGQPSDAQIGTQKASHASPAPEAAQPSSAEVPVGAPAAAPSTAPSTAAATTAGTAGASSEGGASGSSEGEGEEEEEAGSPPAGGGAPREPIPAAVDAPGASLGTVPADMEPQTAGAGGEAAHDGAASPAAADEPAAPAAQDGAAAPAAEEAAAAATHAASDGEEEEEAPATQAISGESSGSEEEEDDDEEDDEEEAGAAAAARPSSQPALHHLPSGKFGLEHGKFSLNTILTQAYGPGGGRPPSADAPAHEPPAPAPAGEDFPWVKPAASYDLNPLLKLVREMVRQAVNADRAARGLPAAAPKTFYVDAGNRPDWWPLPVWEASAFKRREVVTQVYNEARKVLAAVHGAALQPEGDEAKKKAKETAKAKAKR